MMENKFLNIIIMGKTNWLLKTIIYLSVIISSSAYAQVTYYGYSYDNVGNRIQRMLTVCSTCPNNQRTENPNHVESNADTLQMLVSHHEIGVFPNPTQDILNVNITNVETDETVDLFLSDETGRTLLNLKNQPAISALNVANYKTGAYYLQVKVGNDSPKVYKIMKIE